MSGKRVRSLSFNVNVIVDRKLLKFLDNHSNKNAYIKNLIAADYMKYLERKRGGKDAV